MTEDNYKKGQVIKYMTNYTYITFVALYLAYLLLLTTMFGISFPEKTEQYLLIGIAITGMFRMIAMKQWNRYLLVGLVMAAVYTMSYKSTGYRFLLFLAVLTVCSIGINYRLVLKIYSVCLGVVLSASMLASMSGAITNLIYSKENYIRSSWGIVYPTDFASYFVFLLLMIWIAWRISDELLLIFSLLGFAIVRFIARSQTSTYCFLLIFMIALGRLMLRFIKKHRLCENVAHKGKIVTFAKGIGNTFLTLSFPAFMAGFMLLVLMYQKNISIAYKLNWFMTSRIQLASDALTEHGMSLFGRAFDQIGGGGSTFKAMNYNFVDSTYPLIFIRYGIVLGGVLCVIWPLTVRKAIKHGERRLALAMFVIAFHSISEHHFPEINYNILLILLPSILANKESVEERKQKKITCNKKWILTGYIGVWGAVLYVFLPRALCLARTIAQTRNLTELFKNQVGLFLAFALAIIGSCCFVWTLYTMIAGVKGRKNNKRYNTKANLFKAGYLLCCLLVGFAGIKKADKMLDKAEEQYDEVINSDDPALQIVLKNADGKVYTNILPELYQRRYGAFSNSFFFGDELARYQGITVLLDKDYNSDCFNRNGFLYAEISDAHAVYTDDSEVAHALQDAGYHVTGFYSTEKTVDLNAEAQLNNLEIDEETGLQLDGPEHSLIYGPYLDLYQGNYAVVFALETADKEITEDTAICTLRISQYWGNKVLKERTIYGRDLDENGCIDAEIKTGIDASRGVEFLAFAKEGIQVSIKNIKYKQYADRDTHAYYNNNRQIVREEYYDMDGKPMLQDGLVAAVEYGYDGHKASSNRTLRRYYGASNQLVINKQGYAEVHVTYNELRRVVKEEYFGVDGERIMLSSGYAIVTRSYDSDGNVAVEKYYDTEENPVLNTSGYAEIHRQYIDGLNIHEEYYGTDGQLIILSGGYAMLEREYNENKKVTVSRYLDKNGDPVINTSGFAEEHDAYDEADNVVRVEYYGTDGNLIARPNGVACMDREYDENHNIIVEKYYDASNQPYLLDQKYAEIHKEYIDNLNIHEEYYSTDGKILTLAGGYAMVEREYDDNKRAIVTRYLDNEGEAVINTSGFAEEHDTYDDQGNIVWFEYYGTDGKLITRPNGIACMAREYDDSNNIIVEKYYDVQKEPVVKNDAGYAEIRKTYDENRHVTSEKYFDVEGNPYVNWAGFSGKEISPDEKGNAAAETYLDAEGKRMTRTDGFAEIRREFDDSNRTIYEAYYDMDGNQVVNTSGYASRTYAWANGWNAADQKFYDLDGDLTLTTGGYAEIITSYDENNRKATDEYLDTEGKPVEINQGYSTIEYEYDAKGELISKHYLDNKGKEVEVS